MSILLKIFVKGRKHLIKICTILLFTFFVESHAYGVLLTTDYYLGYASSIIEDIIPEEEVEISLEDNILNIRIHGDELDTQTEQRLKSRLEKRQYFQSITLKYTDHQATDKSLKATHAVLNNATDTTEVLPSGVIYNSPVADPKWPKFSVGYQRQLKDIYGKNIFSLSFGENLALLRHKRKNMTYEIGIQAGLFGLMDITKSPTTLINSDYFVGLGLSFVHNKSWQNLLQLSHLSSHLGDELLLNKTAPQRINLSYEALKWLTAYKIDTFRPYIGVGYLVHRDPSNIKPFTLEAGCDYLSKNRFIFQTARYVFGVHTHYWETNNFKPSINVRTGIQFENQVWQGRNLQFLVDYSHGKSRHGQFYAKNEHYIGLLVALAN